MALDVVTQLVSCCAGAAGGQDVIIPSRHLECDTEAEYLAGMLAELDALRTTAETFESALLGVLPRIDAFLRGLIVECARTTDPKRRVWLTSTTAAAGGSSTSPPGAVRVITPQPATAAGV